MPPTPTPNAALPQSAFVPPAAMTSLDLARLSPYLDGQRLLLDPGEPVRQFASGLANINYLIKAGGQWLVLRRPPSGELPPGAHDMAREHRILSRLCRSFPLAPESLHLCTDRAVLGVPFQLIEYRPGLVIKGDDAAPLGGRPDVAARVGGRLIDTLAAIHRVDTHAIGLDDLGRPAGFVARAIAGWRQRAERIAAAPSIAALAREISDWLAVQHLGERAPTLLHCDFKLDNVILAPGTFAPVAVVDWDMGTRGDPLFDLATLLSYWTEAGDPECLQRLRQMPTAAPGFPSRSEVTRAYAAATGIDVSDLPVLRVLAMMKLAVVFLQLGAQFTSGARTDPAYAGFAALGEDLLAHTREIMRGRAV